MHWINYVILLTPVVLILLIIISWLKRWRRLSYTFLLILAVLIAFVAGLAVKNHLEFQEHRNRMASSASNLLDIATLLRENEHEQAINSLDGEINWRLRVAWGARFAQPAHSQPASPSGRLIGATPADLPPDVLDVWQKAKVYYDKYDVVGFSHSPETAEIRQTLEHVPWAQHDADRRAFEAKYKGPEPQIAPELYMALWIGPSSTLEALRGNVVLLDFWGTGCAPCVKSLPEVQRLHEEFAADGLTVIAIHGYSYEPKAVVQFIADNNYTFPCGIDTGMTERKYAVPGIPAYYLIDKAGRLVWGPEHAPPADDQIRTLLQQ